MKPYHLVLLLAACGKQAPQPANETEPATLVAKPAVPASKPFAYDEKNDLIDYHVAWSAEVAAIPQLVERFRAEMEKDKVELLANAKNDKASRGKGDDPFNPWSWSNDYKTAGQSGRLLSLSDRFYYSEDGAHGNLATTGLLWDRWTAKETKFSTLFLAPQNMDRLLTQPWCDALNKAREEKRGEPVGGESMFGECPKLSDISIIPADKDGNGRFDELKLVADPYVAGPWAEGSYEIELPVTGDMITAIRSDYRENFEAQPQ